MYTYILMCLYIQHIYSTQITVQLLQLSIHVDLDLYVKLKQNYETEKGGWGWICDQQDQI